MNVVRLNVDCCNKALGIIHFICAASFFALVAYLAIYRFTKIKAEPGENRESENRLYRWCGWIIIASLIIMGIYEIAKLFCPIEDIIRHFPILFTFETTSLWAFGVAWLVKGKDYQDIKSRLKAKLLK